MEFRGRYVLTFAEEDWEDIRSLEADCGPKEGKPLTHRQWLNLADMLFGRAERIAQGTFDLEFGGDEELVDGTCWAEVVRAIAQKILDSFVLRDGKVGSCETTDVSCESANLACWIDCRGPQNWVEKRDGKDWGHDEWIALLNTLKKEKLWPMTESDIIQTLDDVKETYRRMANQRRYLLEFTEDEWDKIDDLQADSGPEVGKGLAYCQWMNLAYMLLGRAQRIEWGTYDERWFDEWCFDEEKYEEFRIELAEEWRLIARKMIVGIHKAVHALCIAWSDQLELWLKTEKARVKDLEQELKDKQEDMDTLAKEQEGLVEWYKAELQKSLRREELTKEELQESWKDCDSLQRRVAELESEKQKMINEVQKFIHELKAMDHPSLKRQESQTSGRGFLFWFTNISGAFRGEWTCAMCRETVRYGATICPHCHSEVHY